MTYYITTSLVYLFEYFIVLFVLSQASLIKKNISSTLLTGLGLVAICCSIFFLFDNTYVNNIAYFLFVFLWAKLSFITTIRKSII